MVYCWGDRHHLLPGQDVTKWDEWLQRGAPNGGKCAEQFEGKWGIFVHMDVSENGGFSPQIIPF